MPERPERNMNQIREVLFDTLEKLTDAERPMDLGRAKAVASVAQTIINSVTCQVRAMNATNADSSEMEFFGPKKKALPAAGNGHSRLLDAAKIPPDPKDPLQSRKLRTEPPGR